MIHGGWAGSWQWDFVKPLLEEKGYSVTVPDLTGLGRLHHLASPEVTCSTHVQDVLDAMEKEGADDFIMIGFSYGGMVATKTADILYDKIGLLIYLDAFFPEPGDSLFTIFGEKIASPLLTMMETFGEGWKIPFFDTADPRLTDQPGGTGTENIYYQPETIESLRPVYIECTEKPEDWSFTPVLERVAHGRREAGWDVRTFPSDHFPMASKPELLTETIDSIVSELYCESKGDNL